MANFNPADRDGNAMVKCERCGQYYHTLAVHLKSAHGMSTMEYRRQYPGSKTISTYGRRQLSKGHTKGARGTGWTVPSSTPTPAPAAPAPVAPAAKPTPAAPALPPGCLSIGKAVLKVRDDVCEDDALYVPKHDEMFDFDDETLEQMAVGVEMDTNVLMVGPAGCGKTSLAFELASLMNQPTKRVNMNGEFRVADFVGEKVLAESESGATVVLWKDGILTECARKGFWLIIDELDAAPARIMMRLQSVLEPGHPLVLAENNGEVVKVHSNFRIIATANTLGRGDDSGMYTGTNVLNEATLDRFGVVMEVSYLQGPQEISVLVTKTGVTKDVAGKMVDIARKVRDGLIREECFCTMSTRRLLTWAKLTVKWGNARKAAAVAILNRLGKDDRAYVKAIVDRVFY